MSCAELHGCRDYYLSLLKPRRPAGPWVSSKKTTAASPTYLPLNLPLCTSALHDPRSCHGRVSVDRKVSLLRCTRCSLYIPSANRKKLWGHIDFFLNQCTAGLLLVGGLIGAVLLVTLGIVRTPEDVDLFAGDTQESLRQIASQF